MRAVACLNNIMGAGSGAYAFAILKTSLMPVLKQISIVLGHPRSFYVVVRLAMLYL